MYTFVTRNEDANNLEMGNVQPITAVMMENDPQKQIKGEKMFLYNGDKILGCLAVEEGTLLTGTESAASLSVEDIIGHALMSKRMKGATHTFCRMELFPEKDTLTKKVTTETNDDETNDELILPFGGTRTTCPGKRPLSAELAQGNEVSCELTRDGSSIIAIDSMGRICGKLLEGQALPDIFAKMLTVKGKARVVQDPARWRDILLAHSSNRKPEVYEVVVSPKEKKAGGDYLDKINELNRRCIAHSKDVAERIDYMEQSGIPEELIHKVLDNYIEYPLKEFDRIKNPPRKFIDNEDGYLQRSIVYMLTGQNIRFVGGKGCGKNTLLDTLSWVFNQPLYKIGCSERTDEYVVFGGTQVKNGDTIHRLSPFAHGLTVGALCVLDEANMVPPELMSTINQLTDDTREVDINNYGKLKVHDRTRVFMTMNEDYQGTCQLNDATLDRFQGIFMGLGKRSVDYFLSMVPDAEKKDVEICSKIYENIFKQYKNRDISESALTTRGYIAALQASSMMPLRICLYDSIAGRMQDPDIRESIKSTIDSYCENL